MAQPILESGDSAFSNPLEADSVLKFGQEDSLEPADQDSEKAARSTAGSSDVLYWGQRKRVRCSPRTGSESNDGEKPLGRVRATRTRLWARGTRHGSGDVSTVGYGGIRGFLAESSLIRYVISPEQSKGGEYFKPLGRYHFGNAYSTMGTGGLEESGTPLNTSMLTLLELVQVGEKFKPLGHSQFEDAYSTEYEITTDELYVAESDGKVMYAYIKYSAYYFTHFKELMESPTPVTFELILSKCTLLVVLGDSVMMQSLLVILGVVGWKYASVIFYRKLRLLGQNGLKRE
ncbi:hypothetical protein V1525DRAFT_389029 [Lipomyces kononenkoae]|uniref:Uncharacterized protein n=1 Tax=Lipomyces kononenkoae TaxID=34357 RepID=A0ACC3SZ51_LIPKO